MNNLLLFWAPGGWELIIILVIVLILFGANRLPQLAKGMGESIRNFKTGMSEAEAEEEKKDKAKAALGRLMGYYPATVGLLTFIVLAREFSPPNQWHANETTPIGDTGKRQAQKGLTTLTR